MDSFESAYVFKGGIQRKTGSQLLRMEPTGTSNIFRTGDPKLRHKGMDTGSLGQGENLRARLIPVN